VVMERTPLFLLSEKTKKFLIDFTASHAAFANLKDNNDQIVNSAFIYEKVRVALEYQEEHLVFKNAIARILRRQYTLAPNISAEHLLDDFISEMSWANYINPELLSKEYLARMKSTVERYLVLLKQGKSGHFQRAELQKMVIDWLACELDEILRPTAEVNVLLDYTYSILKKNLDIEGARINEGDNEIQLKMAIYMQVFKPDLPLVQYWLIRTIYPEWQKMTPDEIKKIGWSFDPFYNKIDRELNHPMRKRYVTYIKRNIAPFILLKDVLSEGALNLDQIREKPFILRNLVMEEYTKVINIGRRKVWTATIRALIFILFTKISLAFILEIPFDKFSTGKINLLSLIINISMPPLLMLIAGTFVKSPPKRNYQVITEAFSNIAMNDRIDDKKFSLANTKKSPSFAIFNIVYSAITIAILAGVIWLLIYLKFNIISILLFFLFVSIVSFFAFRIRNIALELAMRRAKDDAITSAMELIFLPFIRIGKYMSDRFAAFNPLILALDFLIEAPLKTVIKIFNSWLKFINSKKEDLEF